MRRLTWRASRSWRSSPRSSPSSCGACRGGAGREELRARPLLGRGARAARSVARGVPAAARGRPAGSSRSSPRGARGERRPVVGRAAAARCCSETLHGEGVVIVANREPYIHERAPDGAIEVVHPASGLVTALEPVMRACSGHLGRARQRHRRTARRSTAHDRVRVPPGEESYALRRVWLTRGGGARLLLRLLERGALAAVPRRAHAAEVPRRGLARVRAREPPVRGRGLRGGGRAGPDRPRAGLPLRARAADDPRAAPARDHHHLLAHPVAERGAVRDLPVREASSSTGCSGAASSASTPSSTATTSSSRWTATSRRASTASGSRSCSAAASRSSAATPSRSTGRTAGRRRRRPPTSAAASVLARARARRRTRCSASASTGSTTRRASRSGSSRWSGSSSASRTSAAGSRSCSSPRRAARSSSSYRAAERARRGARGAHQRALRRRRATGRSCSCARTTSRRAVFRYLRAADVCYVSSLHDGMNLVAKEFVAAREDERGVLVLSRFTGAARELTEALIVNPYDLEEASAALATALAMPADEQRGADARDAARSSPSSTSTAGRGGCSSTPRALRQRGRLSDRLADGPPHGRRRCSAMKLASSSADGARPLLARRSRTRARAARVRLRRDARAHRRATAARPRCGAETRALLRGSRCSTRARSSPGARARTSPRGSTGVPLVAVVGKPRRRGGVRSGRPARRAPGAVLGARSLEAELAGRPASRSRTRGSRSRSTTGRRPVARRGARARLAAATRARRARASSAGTRS